MSLRDLVTGNDMCTPSDGAGPSNAVGGLVNTLFGGAAKTQEQLRELPTFQPGLGGRQAGPITPQSAAIAAAMQPGMQIPGLGPSTMDRAGADAFMRGMPSTSATAPSGWDAIFHAQGHPGRQVQPGLQGVAMPPPIEQHIQGFMGSARHQVHFQPGMLPPQATASLSVADKCRIRDRATILARHMYADRGEHFADQQVSNLLASMHINPTELPAELPHVHSAGWHDVWRDASAAPQTQNGRPMVAAELAAGAQRAPWEQLWGQQQGHHHTPSTGWVSEFHQQQVQRPVPGAAQAWVNDFSSAHPAEAWAADFAKEHPAGAWANAYKAEAAAQEGQADVQRGRDGTEEGAMRSTAILVDQLSRDPDPKMRNSKFLQFMSKLSHGEVGFDDNKVVERPGSTAWVNEFSAGAAAAGATGAAAGWADEFRQQNGVAPASWATEFAGAESGLKAGAWAAEFEAKQREAAAAAPTAEWADEFAKGVADLKLDDTSEAMHKAWAETNEWADQFNRESEEDNFQEWERIYGHGQVDTSYGPSGTGEYVFARNNPFQGDLAAEAKGRDLFRRGILTEAVLALEAAVQADPGNAQAWRLLGTVQAENDDDKQAIAAMGRALQADPTNLDVLLNLGVSHTNELDQAEALTYLTRWLAAHPDYAGVAARAGPLLDSSQRVSHVVRQFEEASRMKPEDAELYMALGVLAHLSRQYDSAVQSFQHALQLRPQDYSLWNKLGATLANNARSTDAIGAYQKALDLKPNYMRAWTNMGISFANLGDYDKSARFYVRALTLNPQAAHLWGYLRTSLACAGMTDAIQAVDNQDLPTLQQRLPL